MSTSEVVDTISVLRFSLNLKVIKKVNKKVNACLFFCQHDLKSHFIYVSIKVIMNVHIVNRRGTCIIRDNGILVLNRQYVHAVQSEQIRFQVYTHLFFIAGNITVLLYFLTPLYNFFRHEKILKLCNVMGLDLAHDPDETYELTTDNVKKIMAIYMRFR